MEHTLIFKDPYTYCAHAHMAVLPDGEWVAVFNQVRRRSFILHPPNDPLYYNVLIRSKDDGRTWNTPRVVPGYDWHGVECAGLTVLQDGALLLNQWRFNWYPLETARKMAKTRVFSFPEDWVAELMVSDELTTLDSIPTDPAEYVPWARSGGSTWTHRSTDGGRTWETGTEIATAPYSGGYGMRGGVQLSNGEVVLPLSDIPNYKVVFLIRSSDGGRSWGAPIEAARSSGKEFEEPALLAFDDRHLLMLLRDNKTHYLHSVRSLDGGYTWSEPHQTDILGYPAHLLKLPDGRLLCTYGYRYEPYGIRAVLSSDEGRTWDTQHPLILRDDLPNRDLGYPATVLTSDGSLFTIYYAQDVHGDTGIWATRFTLKD
jgi:hypothetical protein